MQVHHILPHVHSEASGPSYTVSSLCSELERHGDSVTLHVLQPQPNDETRFNLNVYQDWRFARRLGVSPAMRRGLERAARQADIMHSHSLWMMPNVYPAWAVRGTQCRLVVAPRGTLEPWSLQHSYWRKRIMWNLLQRSAVRTASCMHATAECELQSIRAVGLKMPVAILPNGVNVPQLPPDHRPKGGLRRLLYLGRIHPKKGLENLIHAWVRQQDQFSDWELRIVGPDEYGHRTRLRQLASSLGADRVNFLDPVFGEAKSEEYQRADLFVLPTHSENFAMVVAEALAHETPAICTKGAPWQGLETNDCGWWIDIGIEPLAECLRHALSLNRDALAKRGARGRAWMQRDFSWRSIAERTHALYEWLLGGGSPPSFVDCVKRAA